jgi:ATP-dependent Lon protease
VLPVGGTTEKVRSIMDLDLGMIGACIPWQNKYDIEPLLLNADSEYIQEGEVPGIRIFRSENRFDPFDIFFCKTKHNAYAILMGLKKQEIEDRMAERSSQDLAFIQNLAKKNHPPDRNENAIA